MSDITFERYNKHRLVVYTDRETYGKELKALGAKWNKQLKTGKPGWTLAVEKEQELTELLEQARSDQRLDEMKTHAKSRKNQDKYHRAVSDTEEEEKLHEVAGSFAVIPESVAAPPPSPEHPDSDDNALPSPGRTTKYASSSSSESESDTDSEEERERDRRVLKKMEKEIKKMKGHVKKLKKKWRNL